MEAAVRWSPHSTPVRQRFLVVDVADPALTLNEVDSLDKEGFQYHAVSRSGRIANFGAFDWSKTDESLVALGLVSGSASIIRLKEGSDSCETASHYKIKQQRKCNSIALSTQDWLAVAVDRARSDICLFVHDAGRGPGASGEALRRLCAAEVVSSVRFFPHQPREIVASTQRAYIRIYDLRDGANTTGNVQAATKNVNNITIDPLDDNYFASAGSTDDPSVTVWDRRWLSSSSTSGSTSGAVFDFRPAVNNSTKTTVWSLRYSGRQRGRLALCSSTGEISIIDMVEGKARRPDYIPPNPHGGGMWSSGRYVSQTKVLEGPYHDPRHGREIRDRVIAFDWINHSENSIDGQGLLMLRPNRQVQALRVPESKPLARVTGRDDLSISAEDISITEPARATGATRLQMAPGNRNETEHAEDFGPYAGEKGGEAADDAVHPRTVPRDSPVVSHLLRTLTLQAERCRSGYLFDCRRNLSITSGSQRLGLLWESIARFRELAVDDGMLHSGLDLSYVGIAGLWSEVIGLCPRRQVTTSPCTPAEAIVGLNSSKELPAFEGERTDFPEHRQLCLAVCGWKFTVDSLEAECQELIERGLHYQAIVQAVLHGYTHIALNLLRMLIRSRTIPNIGLGALLASDDINAEQREMCLWMAADTEDPALKALLAYLVSGDWRDVMKTNYLHLGYRLALGLKYLNDTELSGFIQSETARAVKNGDLEGVLLTGLTEQSMDLFQTYVTRTNDLQTAVLATAFTNPLYVDDVRWEMWKETYFMQMQMWRCFIERTKFTVQHNRMARTREGKTLIEQPPAQVKLRCLHCNSSLAKIDGRYISGQAPPESTAVRIAPPPAISGTVCPRCGRHMPRCSICLMWLGTPNPATPGGAKELEMMDDVMAKMITFCKICGHGFHADHARSWFGKHQVCPVPDCRCACGVLS